MFKKYLIHFVIFLSIFACSKSRKTYEIDNVVLHPSTKNCEADLDYRIESSKLFVENFINSYLDLVYKEVDAAFLDSFLLTKSKLWSARAFFSTISESFIYIFPAEKNELLVDCLTYPVQMSLFGGLEIEGQKTKLVIPLEKALKEYRNSKVMFAGADTGIVFYLLNIGVETSGPKVFSFMKNSIAVLSAVTIKLVVDKKILNEADIEQIGFLTGEKDFSFAQGKAKEIGHTFAENRIIQLFTSSKFFREALVYKFLSPLAKDILSKVSHVEKEARFDYPYWKFKMDVEILTKEALKFGLDARFVDELFKDPKIKPHDGHLLWYYKNHAWFMLQWILINFVILAILLIERLIFKRKKIKILEGISKSAVIITVNGWIFHSRPDYIHIIYWILPGLLFLICIFLTFKHTEEQ